MGTQRKICEINGTDIILEVPHKDLMTPDEEKLKLDQTEQIFYMLMKMVNSYMGVDVK